MNRVKVREVIDSLGLKVVQSDGRGVQIASGPQVWRVYTGGGIVGNSDSAWLAPVSIGTAGEKEHRSGTARRSWPSVRGPFWNKAALKKALRAWRKEAGLPGLQLGPIDVAATLAVLECPTCFGVGRIRDAETRELCKCLDCNGAGMRVTGPDGRA